MSMYPFYVLRYSIFIQFCYYVDFIMTSLGGILFHTFSCSPSSVPKNLFNTGNVENFIKSTYK